jgi:hypothetical protein
VNSQPFRTATEKDQRLSDITNLMFLGRRDQIEEAFKQAGWTPAAKLNDQSKLETFRAMAEMRGYQEAPVSVLLLDGRPPDLVFEKNQRHVCGAASPAHLATSGDVREEANLGVFGDA